MYPISRSCHRQALGSTGSARHARSPASRLLRLTPTPDPRPARLLLVAELYHQRARLFAPRRRRDTAPTGQENSGSASPLPIALVEGIGPPRFLNQPQCQHALLSDPGGTVHARRTRHAHTAFRGVHNVGSRLQGFIVAQSHCLLTHCLRFARSVTEQGARLASGWLPASTGWGSHPLGCTT